MKRQEAVEEVKKFEERRLEVKCQEAVEEAAKFEESRLEVKRDDDSTGSMVHGIRANSPQNSLAFASGSLVY